MINHVRTLILNRAGDKRPPADSFLEEFVDPGFRPLELPGYLANLYEILIGVTADEAYANWRLRQYTSLLHSTEFAAYVSALDPRVSYLRPAAGVDAPRGNTFVKLNGAATRVHFIGRLAPTPAQRRLQYDWRVELLTPLFARTTDLRTGKSADTAFTVAEGLSSSVILAGQDGLKLQLETPTAGAQWSVQAFAPPRDDPADLVATLAGAGGAALGQLFGPVPTEPFKTFQQLWSRHAFLAYQLSGFLLAYAYRVEEIRTGG